MKCNTIGVIGDSFVSRRVYLWILLELPAVAHSHLPYLVALLKAFTQCSFQNIHLQGNQPLSCVFLKVQIVLACQQCQLRPFLLPRFYKF